MKPQEIVTVFTKVKPKELDEKANLLILYPELDAYFDKGMYVEKVTQASMGDGTCMITFVFRYYNASQSKVD